MQTYFRVNMPRNQQWTKNEKECSTHKQCKCQKDGFPRNLYWCTSLKLWWRIDIHVSSVMCMGIICFKYTLPACQQSHHFGQSCDDTGHHHGNCLFCPFSVVFSLSSENFLKQTLHVIQNSMLSVFLGLGICFTKWMFGLKVLRWYGFDIGKKKHRLRLCS